MILPLRFSHRLAQLTLIFLAVASAGLRGSDAVPLASYDPVEHYELDFQTGIIWRAGHNGSGLNYIVLPQIFTLKTPYLHKWKVGGGDLVIRSRYSLLIEPIVKGPEHHYFGASASGILEWWDVRRTRMLFFTSGGGAGFLDSKGYEVKGAQGQDFNLNWFAYFGGSLRAAEHFSLTAGFMYQHISNGGMDKVNPGLDAVGPMASANWHF